MATTLQEQIAELNAAIASPERQVTLGSQNMTLRSIDDLIKARNDLQQQLDDQAATTSSKRPKRTLAYYSGRGY